jgi:23S rRNA (guanosine2251-2'-O)-methyltransferase
LAKKNEAEAPAGSRVIFGNHALNEFFFKRPQALRQLWVKDDWKRNQNLREYAERLKNPDAKIIRKPEAVLDRFGNHQGAIAFADPLPDWDLNQLISRKKTSIMLFLDGIVDPHNLGAILRSCWLLGVDAVFASSDRAVGLTPTVHKVACGGVEHVPLMLLNQLQQVAKPLKDAGYWFFGLDQSGREGLYGKKLPERIVWVIGSEEKGMRSSTRGECDEFVGIPQVNAAASYNASVAAALALGETFRQNGQ